MKYYFRHRVVLDILIAIASTYIVFYWSDRPKIFHFSSNSSLENFSFYLFSTAASLLGFILAASTFLVSHIDHPRFELIKLSKSYKQLSLLMSSSLWRLFWTMILSGLMPFFNQQYVQLAVVGLLYSITLTLFSIAATLWVIINVFSIPTADSKL